VLSEIHSQVHVVDIIVKDGSISCEFYVSQWNYMLAILLMSACKNLILICELLSKHKVKSEVIIPPESEDTISAYQGCYGLDEAVV
jgi:hypothetical protein